MYFVFALNFLRTGFYSRSDGHNVARLLDSYWWASGIPWWYEDDSSTIYAFSLGLIPTVVNTQHTTFRGLGFAIRCPESQHLRDKHSSHGHYPSSILS